MDKSQTLVTVAPLVDSFITMHNDIYQKYVIYQMDNLKNIHKLIEINENKHIVWSIYENTWMKILTQNCP